MAEAGMEPASPLLQKLLDDWMSRLQGGQPLPVEPALDLLDLPLDVLRYCLLVDVRDDTDGGRFRFRYVGQEIVRRYGEDPTGRYLDEMDFGDKTQLVRAHYKQAVERHEPVRFYGEVRKKDGRWLRFERLLLPFSSDGSRADKVVAGIVHEMLSDDG